MPIEQATAADLVARVEAHLREHPEDGRGWDVLRPSTCAWATSRRRPMHSRRRRGCWANRRSASPASRARIIMLQNGVVNEPARQAYEKLLALEPQSIEPQVGSPSRASRTATSKGAEAEYRTLLAGAEEPWKGLLEARLQAVTRTARRGAATAAKPDARPRRRTPTGGLAAAAMSPADATSSSRRWSTASPRASSRTATTSKAGCGWCAPTWCSAAAMMPSTALASARGQFSGDEKSLAELNVLAESLGLGS